MPDIFEGLNDKQKEAVRYTEGPLLLLAGAGSGKTRVLTHRIAYILERGLCEPWQILAITFTNKAAGEMRERVDRLIPGEGHDVFVSTFHSMCVRMLRRDIDKIGYNRDFSIYDTDDQKTLMRAIIKDLKLDPRQYRERGVLSAISDAKNKMIDEELYEQNALDFYDRGIAKAYTEYQARLRKNNALDFDDLLLKTVDLFKEFPEVLDSWQRRFVYILVDEYQDTNMVQFELVRLLSARYKNLCVVGDDDQSIYKFRGADITNILDFEKSFPGSKVIKLEQNYRSTKSILRAANGVIRNNTGRKDKTLWTENPEGELPTFTEYDTAGEEAEKVINAASSCGIPYKNQAILYRTNAQSRLFEEKCIRASVPYTIVGGVNFYQRKEIKDILSYLRIIANGVDDLACERIVNVPKRGIGDTTIDRAAAFASMNGLSLYDAFCTPESIPGLNRGTVGKITAFTDVIEHLRDVLKEGTEGSRLKRLVETVREDTGYAEELKKEGTIEYETRMENIEELISKAVSFEEDYVPAEGEDMSDGIRLLSAFLEDVSLVADIDRTDSTDDVLTMMTLHAAKGLEFDRVFLCGMEEGLFPSMASINSPDPKGEIEEERRLCYVGMTRAKKILTMTSACERMINGETRYAKVSRFVEEIPDDAAEFHRKARRAASWDDDGGWEDEDDSFGRSRKEESRSRKYEGFGSGSSIGYYSTAQTGGYGSLDVSPKIEKKAQASMQGFVTGGSIAKQKPDYEAGDRVHHVKFGNGTVKAIEEKPKDYQVTVEFDGCGQKILLAGFAKLEKIR